MALSEEIDYDRITSGELTGPEPYPARLTRQTNSIRRESSWACQSCLMEELVLVRGQRRKRGRSIGQEGQGVVSSDIEHRSGRSKRVQS